MRYIKTYEGIFNFFKQKKKEKDPIKLEIHKICKSFNITNYIIDDNYYIDVDGDVNISNIELKQIPIKFGKVNGTFDCSYNMLHTLKNAPYWVGGNFICSNQYYKSLISLKGAPEYVGYNFRCGSNENLKSFKYGPKEVRHSIDINYTGIYSLDNIPKVNLFNCRYSPIGRLISFAFQDSNMSYNLNQNSLELLDYFDMIRDPKNEKPILYKKIYSDFIKELDHIYDMDYMPDVDDDINNIDYYIKYKLNDLQKDYDIL